MNVKGGENFSEKLLREPPLDCQVTYSWLWNVPITKELIDRSIEDAKSAGIKSLYMICMPKDFRPETMRTFLEPEYLTPEFFELLSYANRRLVEEGMMPWLYDEGGWPSGSACGRTAREYPEAKTTLLKYNKIKLSRGESYSPCKNFLALFDKKERLPEDYTAKEDVELTEYFFGPDELTPHFLDYTDPKMTEVFLNNTYEPFKKLFGDLFGERIPLIFTDEPGLKKYVLPKKCFERFSERFGYDLKDYLYVFENDGALIDTDEDHRARRDYGEFLGDLFYENTFKKINAWCEENGVQYSGHLMADNYPEAGARMGYHSIMRVLREFGIPGIDVIWEQIRYPYSGRLPYDEEETARLPFFPRLAPSAARQRGKNLSLTESIGIYGDGITPDEIRYVTGYQVVRGINIISYYHLPINNTRYSALATRPNFRPEKPGFKNLRHINEYVARLTYLSRLGYAEGDTALYHQTDDYYTNPETAERAAEAYKALGMRLEAENVAFDIIDDYGILEARDTGDGLLLGNALYKHFAVPECKYMNEDVKKKIAPYIGIGAPTYTFKNKNLRVMTRRLDSGRLWFIFNEGLGTVNEEFSFGEYENVYKIDLSSGDMTLMKNPEASILTGEIAVFLETSEKYESVEYTTEYTVEARDFKKTAYKRFIVGYDNLSSEYHEGEIEITDDFSGEITYKGSYALKNAPQKGEKYRIRLEDFSLTAAIRLCDETYTLGLSPMERIVDGEYLSELGEIEITVSNTSLNEIKAKEALLSELPRAERGPYIERLAVHEERVAPLRFGKVFIEKLAVTKDN